MPSSGHGLAGASMNVSQLWLPEQDLNRIKPVNISAWMGERLVNSHLQVVSFWQLTATSFL